MAISETSHDQRLHEWIERVRNLREKIDQWSVSQKWITESMPIKIHERSTGEYSIEGMGIFLAPTSDRIYFEPVALNVTGADGRVDLWAFPTLNRIRLVGMPEGWKVFTESNVTMGILDREVFLKLVEDLRQKR